MIEIFTISAVSLILLASLATLGILDRRSSLWQQRLEEIHRADAVRKPLDDRIAIARAEGATRVVGTRVVGRPRV